MMWIIEDRIRHRFHVVMAAGCRNSVASIPQAGTGVMESRKRAVASPISCAEESRIPSAHSRSWMTARRGAIWREDQQRSVRMRSVMLLLLCATGAALVLVSVSEPRPVALRHRPPTAEESETPRSNLGGGLSAPAFPSESFECDYEKAFNASDRLKVFQVYSEPPTSLMEHNRHHLPEGAEFVFVDHLEGMEASMREVSRLLELCGVVEGAYEALMDVRAISTRSNIWRAAMLWAHGGLYMLGAYFAYASLTGLGVGYIPAMLIAAGADGLMIETHPKPPEALSDGPQSLYPDQLKALGERLKALLPVVGRTF